MYVCVFQAKGFCSPRVDASDSTDERLLAAGARELQKQRQGGEMAGWLAV
jgi:hypothetical protein